MVFRILPHLAVMALVSVSGPRGAEAQAADDRTRAAAEFEVGLKLYQRSDFAAAARAFFRADSIEASDDALGNAIAAGRKAGEHLLVARAAERAERRREASADVKAKAREALAAAAPHLARVRLSCEPAPCEIRVGDEVLPAGQEWLLPGTHQAVASHGTSQVREELRTVAGGSYALHLRIRVERGERAPVSPTRRAAPPTPGAPADSTRPLSPAIFYVGAAVTVVLAGVTTWSGLDALKGRDDLPAQPSSEEVDAVRGRVRRTDILLAGSLLVGAATGYAGVAWVDWSGGRAAPSPRSGAGAVGLHLSGRF